TLRDLHSYPVCIRWALQWCACSPEQLCLISRSCSSVQTFAVWLTSVHGSPQTTLPLASASDTTPRTRDFHPLDLFQKRFRLKNFYYIYHSRHTQHLQKIGGSVVKCSFVLRIKFCGGRQFGASKSPTSCSCKPLVFMQD
ncbi:hypothetical protein SAMN05216323_10412, partial [Williamwhitmania taraxaci]